MDILDNLPTGKKIIGFGGPKTSGKDTAAARLLTRNEVDGRQYFRKIAFAGAIKKSCQLMFGLTDDEIEVDALKEKTLERWPYLKPRQILMDEANGLRDRYDGNIHVRAWLRQVAAVGNECVLITDLRFPEEIEMIKNMGGYICYVQRKTAEERLVKEREDAESTGSNVSESHYDLIRNSAHFILPNNAGYEELFDDVEKMVRSIWGSWRDWDDIPLYRREA